MKLLHLSLLLFFEQSFCQYPDVGSEQFVAPPGLPPAMAPQDHEYAQLPKVKGDNYEVLTTTIDFGGYFERPSMGVDENEVGSGSGDFPIPPSQMGSGDGSGIEGSAEEIPEGAGGGGIFEGSAGVVDGSTEDFEPEASGENSGAELEGSAETTTEDVVEVANRLAAEAEEDEVEGEGSGIHEILNDIAVVAQNSGVACKADVLFIIDSTSSVRGVFEEYKQYVAKVIEGLIVSEQQDHVGAILFSGPKIHKEKIKLGKINDSAKLISAVRRLPFLSGITATGAALNFASSALAGRRKGVPTVVVLLTDGFSYDLTAKAAEHLRKLKQVEVYTVAFGSPFIEKELVGIAGDKKRFLKGESSYAQLVRIIKNCPNKPKNVPKLETSTVRHILTATDSIGRHLIPNPVLTNKGYKHFNDKKPRVAAVVRPPIESQNISIEEDRRVDIAAPSCQNDIVLVFDASGSAKTNFSSQLELANEVVDKFVVGPKDTQFAAIKYSGKTRCRVLFNFTQFNKKEDIQNKISATSFSSGVTATNEALMKAADLFKGPGVRKDRAKPILILFTDGFSSDSPIKGATYLHHMGVTVFVIGVGDKPEHVYMEELNMIASDHAHVYLLSSSDKFLVDLEIVGKNCVVQS